MSAKHPTQPPQADMASLVNKVNELATKAGLKTLTSKLPDWKRWVGGEAEFDAIGLRDVVNANAIMLDDVKVDQDTHSQAILDLQADVQALKEVPPARPFP